MVTSCGAVAFSVQCLRATCHSIQNHLWSGYLAQHSRVGTKLSYGVQTVGQTVARHIQSLHYRSTNPFKFTYGGLAVSEQWGPRFELSKLACLGTPTSFYGYSEAMSLVLSKPLCA